MIVAGFGFRKMARAESLWDAFETACAGHMATALATVADKAEAAALLDCARRLGVPVLAVHADELVAQRTLTLSQASVLAHGVGSVAEAAALAAAGSGARLLGARVISRDRLATCALAVREGS